MKKHLIAAAVAAAVAVPAMAQNVSIYGVLDAGIQTHDSGAASNASNTRSTSSTLVTSRLGFRGSEDLGGGLRANFNLEATLGMADGLMGTSSGVNNFDREAWVGISGGFGEIRIGRQDVTAAQDVDILVSQASNLGLAPSNGGTSGELGGDQSNVVKYISPVFNGLQLQVGYSSGYSPTAVGKTTSGTAKTAQQGISVAYNKGPLRLVAGYQKDDSPTPSYEAKYTAYGASYNFGFVSVGGYMAKSDLANNNNDLKTTSLSARYPLANGFALHGVYQATEIENTPNGKGDGYILAVTKAFSKRTTAYAALTDVTNEAASRMSMRGVTAPAAGSEGLDPSAFSVGIVHSF